MRAPARLTTSTPSVIRSRPLNSPIVRHRTPTRSAPAKRRDVVPAPTTQCVRHRRDRDGSRRTARATSLRSRALRQRGRERSRASRDGRRAARPVASRCGLRDRPGAMRSSTCQTDTAGQPTSASAASAAKSGGAVLPPLTASVAECRSAIAIRSRVAMWCAAADAGLFETRTSMVATYWGPSTRAAAGGRVPSVDRPDRGVGFRA